MVPLAAADPLVMLAQPERDDEAELGGAAVDELLRAEGRSTIKTGANRRVAVRARIKEDPGEEVDAVIDRLGLTLLSVMLPHYFDFQSVPDDLVDARIPLEGQQERFAPLGWDTIPSTGRLMQRMVEYVEGRVAIHIIAGELNSAGRPCRHDDRLLTEDDDADAPDTYDSDTDAAAYGGDEL